MPVERLGGAVVYAENDGVIELALVHDVFGHWTLSKGHLESEDVKEEIQRKVEEEIGLEIVLQNKLGENEYVAADPDKGKIRKQVTYYLASTEYADLKLPEDKGGLDDAKWFPLTEIVDLNFYDDIMPIVTDAIEYLLEDDEE
jgi:ADP-ribose pyrophosphatase YjhB (NUDIX family)